MFKLNNILKNDYDERSRRTFFRSIEINDTVIGPLASGGETFELIMKVEQSPDEGVATVAAVLSRL